MDPLDLLLELRRQLGRVESVWPPFDLALHSMHRALRPGAELRLTTPSGVTTTLTDIVGAMISEGAGTLIPGAGIAVDAGRSILAQARDASRARRALRDYPSLRDLIEDCERLPDTSVKLAQVAGRVAFMLTSELSHVTASQRPLVVVFVDHLERLQQSGDSPLGEHLLNRLAFRLPYFLFVMTGRSRLQWAEHDATHLERRGPNCWPLLALENTTEEPRQHAIEYLSEQDAEAFLEESFRRNGIEVEFDLADRLVADSGGWPIHLDLMVAAAQGRAEQERPVRLEDLAGPLPQLVDRVLKDLPHDQAEAFRAACLLPYFDTALVAKAGAVRVGAVERLVERSLVRPNAASQAAPTYPYRIHDTLRRIVREAGSGPTHGWAATDWEHHSQLAVEEAQRRFEEAMLNEDDRGAIASLALALNLAAENDVFGSWFPKAVQDSPGVRALGPLIPSRTRPSTNVEIVDLLDYIRLRERGQSEDVASELRAVMDRGHAIASTAGLWAAYDHRRLGRTRESVDVLAELADRFPERANFYQFQQAITLTVNRQFADALPFRMRLSDDLHRESVEFSTRRSHGHPGGSARHALDRADRNRSRRYKIELWGDALTYALREGELAVERAREVHKIAIDAFHDVAQAQAASVLGQLLLFDDEAFAAACAESAELSRRRHQPYASHATLLLLGGWARNDDVLVSEAQSLASSTIYRGSAWIPVEIGLAHLGKAVNESPTQWIEPVDEVEDRWIGLLERIIADARRRGRDRSSSTGKAGPTAAG
ncbi:hypothetical protein [Nocardioides mangrovi]|uniref:ATP-binding protein n=1 Tax=Nocardioides mangrovi TaxID=2874580 RepID=A0ABS7U7K6_9ACTN|nr:hypothetical protein [Nocardioides mangrovi]MBZ5736921.1 hypothetical protein [Nocardioides mangrovi]